MSINDSFCPRTYATPLVPPPIGLHNARLLFPLSAGELEGSALPSNETNTTEFCRPLPDRLLDAMRDRTG